MSEKHDELAKLMEELRLKVTSEFIPWSRSRSFKKDAKPSDYNFNYEVTLYYCDAEVLATDYSMGYGHSPSYKQSFRGVTVSEMQIMREECESGRVRGIYKLKKIEPDPVDVLHSLVLNMSVLDYRRFEDWAAYLGFNPDSIKDEKIYRACVDIGLQMRNVLGENVLKRLQEAFQGY